MPAFMFSKCTSFLKRGFGIINRTRLGFPRHVFQGAGGIGDDLMCSTVFRELRKRRMRGIVFATQYPSLFFGNPDLDAVIYHENPRLNRWMHEGLRFVRLGYGHYDPATDKDGAPAENVLAALCRIAGITGVVELRPYLYLTPEERNAGLFGKDQIAIQSSALAAFYSMQNKEWVPGRFQEVCDHFRTGHTLIQIGAAQDPKLEGVLDFRGQTNLRQSAAILASSSVFIGLEGLVMHLARAVDCRSVIIYGGRLRPWQIGYTGNINLSGDTPCSPCWQRNRCDYHHECMAMITSEAVVRGAQAQLARQGQPMEVETVVL